ncbi:hypothetical protein LBMAG42_36840 [Deltaproteobacteria bacterium]|nr:hypothetical protein LBMAG42_36840 [Deltaproteobacteria bacterium]
MPEPRWEILLEEGWPTDVSTPYALALEVDPRARTARLAPRVVGADSLEVRSGAVSRSFFTCGPANLRPAGLWLDSAEGRALLDEVGAGFRCEVLWSGDPVVSWSEAAWEAGHTIYERVASLLEPIG